MNAESLRVRASKNFPGIFWLWIPVCDDLSWMEEDHIEIEGGEGLEARETRQQKHKER
jgi:hypothetical protein